MRSDYEIKKKILLLGYPDFLGRKLAEKILADEDSLLAAIVSSGRMDEARTEINGYPPSYRARVKLYEGEISSLDFGLKGPEYDELLSSATHMYHAGMGFQLRFSERYLRERNVIGTRNAVDFCRESKKLERFFFFSSVHASGTAKGTVLETDFNENASFKSYLEKSFHTAEKMIRGGAKKAPYTIFRLANMIGDSKTGEIDGFDGPYLFVKLMSMRKGLPLLLPGSCAAKSHLIPVDYAVAAAYYISTLKNSEWKTYHIIDERSLPVNRVLRIVCDYLGHKQPIFNVPAPALKALYLLPSMRGKLGLPKDVARYLNHNVTYDNSLAKEALADSGIVCPKFETYFPATLESAERKLKEEKDKKEEAETADPLAESMEEET